MRLTAAARELYAHSLIDYGRMAALVDEALEHGDPDYEPHPSGLPPWRRRYGGPFCDARVIDPLAERLRRGSVFARGDR